MAVKNRLTEKSLQELSQILTTSLANKLIGGLLKGMRIAFDLSNRRPFNEYGPLKGYHKNIHGFTGRYLFGAQNGSKVAAIFSDGKMQIIEKDIEDWDLKVSFKSDSALLSFLIFGQMDILKPILNNDVEVEGNVNYLFKFGFMARDLLMRYGLPV